MQQITHWKGVLEKLNGMVYDRKSRYALSQDYLNNISNQTPISN